MGIDFENLRGMGVGIEMTFENGYGCGYSSTHPVPTPRPSLATPTTKGLGNLAHDALKSCRRS